MKHTLTLSALAIVAGYAAIDFAKTAGIHVPDILNLGNAVLAFVLVLLGLVVNADYSRPRQPLALPRRVAPAVRRPSVATAQRHVYAIRRGAEAARLATAPAKIVVFPRNTPSHRQHAA